MKAIHFIMGLAAWATYFIIDRKGARATLEEKRAEIRALENMQEIHKIMGGDCPDLIAVPVIAINAVDPYPRTVLLTREDAENILTMLSGSHNGSIHFDYDGTDLKCCVEISQFEACIEDRWPEYSP